MFSASSTFMLSNLQPLLSYLHHRGRKFDISIPATLRPASKVEAISGHARSPSISSSGPPKTPFDHVTVRAASCCAATDICVMRAGFWKGAGMTACNNSQATASQAPPCSRLEQVTFFFTVLLPACQASSRRLLLHGPLTGKM